VWPCGEAIHGNVAMRRAESRLESFSAKHSRSPST
jgi:hypothetical protein